MIFLKIQHFTTKGKIYSVTLGNGCSFNFKTEKSCKCFLCKTSKFLTEKFNQLNLIFGDAFLLYRQNYFYLDNSRHTPHQQLYTTRRQVNEDIKAIEDLFEKLSFNSYMADANRVMFQQLFQICNYLTEVILHVKQVNSSKSFATVDIRADFLLNQVLSIKSELQNYNLSKAVSFDHDQLTELNQRLNNQLRIVG
jgi:hypothetical protein